MLKNFRQLSIQNRKRCYSFRKRLEATLPRCSNLIANWNMNCKTKNTAKQYSQWSLRNIRKNCTKSKQIAMNIRKNVANLPMSMHNYKTSSGRLNGK